LILYVGSVYFFFNNLLSSSSLKPFFFRREFFKVLYVSFSCFFDDLFCAGFWFTLERGPMFFLSQLHPPKFLSALVRRTSLPLTFSQLVPSLTLSISRRCLLGSILFSFLVPNFLPLLFLSLTFLPFVQEGRRFSCFFLFCPSGRFCPPFFRVGCNRF